MSITRSRLTFEDHYTQLPNRWARDGRLTLKARGLLAQLLSHRTGWRVSVSALVAVNPEGRDAIRGAILELEDHGYLSRTQAVDDETGKFGGVEYVLADPWADKPSTGEPSSENPTSGEPTSANPPHKNTIPTEDQGEEDQGKNVGDSTADAPLVGELITTDELRPDVMEVCGIVADHVYQVTGKRPSASKRWDTQARLMLDSDGHTVDDVRAVMAWVTASSFWSPNILSVPKLREKWPTLVGQARRDASQARGGWLQQEMQRAATFASGSDRQ